MITLDDACFLVFSGTLAVGVYHMGVFFLGALWGVVNASLLHTLLLSRLSYSLCECNDILWGLSLASAITCGTVAVFAHDHAQDSPPSDPRKMLIFLQTSFVGAYLVVKGLSQAAGHPMLELGVGTSDAAGLIQEQQLLALMVAALALAGTGVQRRWTHLEHCGIEEPYRYDGLSQEGDPEKGWSERGPLVAHATTSAAR